MSAHTPGPWRLMSLPDSPIGNRIVAGADDICPCEVYGGIRESDANARLIAAAPALAQALRTLADYSEAVARGDDDATPSRLRCISAGMMAEAVTAARAALSAAGVE